jgi:hypothetical protein
MDGRRSEQRREILIRNELRRDGCVLESGEDSVEEALTFPLCGILYPVKTKETTST